MAGPKLSKLEFQIMEALWTQGDLSIREVQEAFPAKGRPAYTTIQTTIYRLEVKGVVRRIKKENAPENFGLLRRLALCLLKKESTSKRSIKGKRLRASWDEGYLRRVLGGNAEN